MSRNTIGDGVDKGRREEHRRLLREGDPTLKGTKYQRLRNPGTMSREETNAFATLRDSHLKTARARATKEMAMDIWRHQQRGWAEKAWQEWLGTALPARAHAEGGGDNQAAPVGHSQCHCTGRAQRSCRKHQQSNTTHQSESLQLP